MKVLLIAGSYPPMKCGVGTYTQKLACALAEFTDIKVTVLTDVRALVASNQGPVDVLPVMNGWRIPELIDLAKHIKRVCPDIVHIQYPTQGYIGKAPKLMPLLMKFLGVFCMQTWHEPAVVSKHGLFLLVGLKQLITVRKDLMARVPQTIKRALSSVELSLIPNASMLPTITLQDSERSEIRQQYVSNQEMLLVFYGFVAPLKGIESLFDIVAKTNSHLLMVCDFDQNDHYHKSLLDLLSKHDLKTRTTIIGFLQDDELSRMLAVADAIVLPFRDGAQDYNTTVDGAVAQGSFVLTTSFIHNGYSEEKNLYYAKPGNVEEMIAAIDAFSGCRIPGRDSTSQWRHIARQHQKIYEEVEV